MNPSIFFNSIRVSLFGAALSASQVSGLEVILAEAARRREPLNNTAYALATTQLETGATMQPVREGFAKSEAVARAYVKKHYAKKYGKPAGPYGLYYYGRGYVQLTWLFNYEKASKKLGFDFVKFPDAVMDPKWAVRILFEGMSEGWFTGKSFKDYIDDKDESDVEDGREFEGARRIVNGTDKAKMIAGYALKYEAALRLAGYGNAAALVVTKSAQPETVAKADGRTAPAINAASNANWLTSLIAAIIAAFKGKSK